MISKMATDTRTRAQLPRALNTRTFSTPTASVTDSRTDAADELNADQDHDLEEEQRRLYDERLRSLTDEIERQNVWT